MTLKTQRLIVRARKIANKGEIEEAKKLYSMVLEGSPENKEAKYELLALKHRKFQQEPPQEKIHSVISLFTNNQIQEALDDVKTLINGYPNSALLYNIRASCCREIGQLDDAVKDYERALALKPDYAEAQYNLGITHQELGQIDTAIKSYEQAITIKPDYFGAHNNLGNIFLELGQMDGAIKQYEKLLAINPNYAASYYHLSSIKQYTMSDTQITQMQSLLSTGKLTQPERIHLCFALAKVNEKLGNQDELFKFLHEGNRLRKEESNYSLDKPQNLFSIIKDLFSTLPTVIEQSLSFEPSAIRPIFIVGMPRSGTTLVEQIISSHHAVHGAGELTTLPTLIAPIARDCLTQNTNLSDSNFLSIRQQYLNTLSSFDVPENVITDKLPLNFQYIGFILSAFPEAKIVHLKRDAKATCWSIYKNNFHQKGIGYGNNMDDLAGFYGLYIELMDFWHQLFPGKIYDICYEDLTTNQEEETRKLLEYCDLDWDENCLNFHKNKRAVRTASSLQVRRKMYQGSSEAWKKHEAYLQPLIKALSSY